MMTLTYKNDKGLTLVVTADSVELARRLVEVRLEHMGIREKIENTQLVPLPTHHRHVRVLSKPSS